MKGAIAMYLRTSLEDYGKAHRLLDQSFSITNQRKLIQNYMAGHEDLTESEVIEYIDDGFSGTNTNRPRFQDMLRDIEAGCVGTVIVKDLSRLGRSYIEIGDFLERVFPMAGIRVIAINDGYDSANFTGTTGGIDIAFRNFIYDSYSKDLSTKVRSAMKVRMEKGKFVSHAPYGYMKSPEDKHHLIPDPETAPVVQDIFRMVLDGRTTSQVAASLNGKGVLTPLRYKQHKLKTVCQNRELLWTHIMVVNILHNYKYTGAMVNHTRESRHLRDKNQRRTSPEEWIIVENAHEPLVSKEWFEKADAMLRHPKKSRHQPSGRTDAVFYCGRCGRKLRRTSGANTCFVCDTASYQEGAACRGLCWGKNDLEKVLIPVYRVQVDLLGKKAAELKAEKNAHCFNDCVQRMVQIDRRLNSIDRKKMQLFESYHDRKLELAAYMEQKAVLTLQAEQLRADRVNLEADYRRRQESQEQREADEARLSGYLLPNAQIPVEQLLIRMYEAIDRVSVFEKSIEVRWKFEDIFADVDTVKS